MFTLTILIHYAYRLRRNVAPFNILLKLVMEQPDALNFVLVPDVRLHHKKVRIRLASYGIVFLSGNAELDRCVRSAASPT